MLTLANGLSNMLFYLEFWPSVIPGFYYPLSFQLFFSQDVCLDYMLPGTEQHNIIPTFQLPTLSLTAEENGVHVKMIQSPFLNSHMNEYAPKCA